MRAPRALARPGLVPDDVRGVLRRLAEAGHRSWIVGGVVRDLLLRRTRHDPDEFDLATPATPQQVQALFPRVIPTGIDHGTVTVVSGGRRIEVTTFRGEGEYLDGRRPSSVQFHGDLERDLARRDFTVNAMAWDPLDGEFRDPFGGVGDLRRRVIRAVGDPAERFAEDGLRPLRAVRFAAQLGFRLDRRTRRAIGPAAGVVESVSRERVAVELARTFEARHASAGIALLDSTGLLAVVLPHVRAIPARARRHSVAVAREVAAGSQAAARRGSPGIADKGERRVRLVLSALLHRLSPEDALLSVVELRMPNRVASGVAGLVRAAPCLGGGEGPSVPPGRVEARRWLSSLGPGVALDALDLWEGDALHQGVASRRVLGAVRALRRRAAAELRGRPPLTVGDLALDGKEVMRIAGIDGRAVGEALRYLLSTVVEDPAANRPETLAQALRAWAGREPQRSA